MGKTFKTTVAVLMAVLVILGGINPENYMGGVLS